MFFETIHANSIIVILSGIVVITTIILAETRKWVRQKSKLHQRKWYQR